MQFALSESEEEDDEELDLGGEGMAARMETFADTPTLKDRSFFITDRQVSSDGGSKVLTIL